MKTLRLCALIPALALLVACGASESPAATPSADAPSPTPSATAVVAEASATPTPTAVRVAIPDVVGLDLASATAAIEAAGLVANPVGSGDEVAMQAPSGGVEVLEGTQVVLTMTTNPNRFEPQTVEGSGASVVPLPAGAEFGVVRATHDGRRNFIVTALDSQNERVDGLFNEIGAYSGTTVWGLLGDTATQLQVEADGAWSLTFEPIGALPELVLPAGGTGDSVLVYRGGAATPTFSHDGERNFIVTAYGDRRNGLVNEIGQYSGTHAMTAGPSIIVIQADGNWTIG